MRGKDWRLGSLLVAAAVVGLLGAGGAAGQAAETAGVITEIKVGRGKVEVRPAGAAEWRPAGPLLALRPGDAVRATENAMATIVLSGGRGAVTVGAAGSPFVVPDRQAGEGRLQKARALLDASLNFLSGGARDVSQAVLTTRGPRPPVVLSPRNTAVLPGRIAFEWLGSRFSRYTVKIVGPGGLVLERAGVTGGRFDYPPDAPPLSPGTRYTFQVVASNFPPQEAWFEVLPAERAQAVRRDLADLEQGVGPAVSPNSLAALRSGLLAREGLFHDARSVLVTALMQDADEPTLHFLLGNLYQKIGLPDLAAEEHDEARFLMTESGRRSAPGTR